MIKIKNLYKSYGRTIALEDISLEISTGSIVYIIGPNASGKTTLLKLILGLIKPTSGEIFVNKIKLNGNHEYRKLIGYMPQTANFPDNLTVREIFNLIKQLRNEEQDFDEELIEKFGIVKEFDKQIKNLSGGTKQKVNASIAFLFNPKILILDEPTAGLDPYASSILKEKIIEENRKGKTIIFTSHVLSELEDITTNFVFLLDGKLIMNCSKDKMKNTDIEDVVISIMKGNMDERFN